LKQHPSLLRWLTQHYYAARDSFDRLRRSKLSSLMTIAVISVTLALPLCFLLLLGNVKHLSDHWQRSAKLSVYLYPHIELAQAERLKQHLTGLSVIKSARLIDKAEGLQQFKRYSGLNEALLQLPENPLPIVIEVTPKTDLNRNNQLALSQLQQQLANYPEVEAAKLDMGWLQRLFGIISLAQRSTLLLAWLFSLATLLIIGNTIRLATQNQRREIEVYRLVGATNSFIRRPFLYTGLYYGLFGGVLACGWLFIVRLWLTPAISQLASSYHTEFRLTGFNFATGLAIIAFGGLIGWLGAQIAAAGGHSTRR